jgi:hypothetical protein
MQQPFVQQKSALGTVKRHVITQSSSSDLNDHRLIKVRSQCASSHYIIIYISVTALDLAI